MYLFSVITFLPAYLETWLFPFMSQKSTFNLTYYPVTAQRQMPPCLEQQIMHSQTSIFRLTQNILFKLD